MMASWASYFIFSFFFSLSLFFSYLLVRRWEKKNTPFFLSFFEIYHLWSAHAPVAWFLCQWTSTVEERIYEPGEDGGCWCDRVYPSPYCITSFYYFYFAVLPPSFFFFFLLNIFLINRWAVNSLNSFTWRLIFHLMQQSFLSLSLFRIGLESTASSGPQCRDYGKGDGDTVKSFFSALTLVILPVSWKERIGW